MFTQTPPLQSACPARRFYRINDGQIGLLAGEGARDKADWILKNHHPQPLEEYQQKELTRILAGVDRDAHRAGGENGR